MGKISTSFRAELNPKLSYHVTAVLCYDYCEYAIFNSKNALLSLGRFTVDDESSIQKGLQDSGILDLKISKFTLASSLAPLNFIQSKSFKANKLKSYFKDIYPADKLLTQTLSSSKLKSQSMHVAFGIPKGVIASFKKQVPKIKFVHLSEPICNYAKKKKINGTLVMIGDGFVAISSHKKGTSYFYNKFDCFGDSDVLYYMSLVFEVLELDNAKEQIVMAGNYSSGDSLSKLLKSEFKKIKVISGFDRYCRKAPNKGAFYASHFLIKQ